MTHFTTFIRVTGILALLVPCAFSQTRISKSVLASGGNVSSNSSYRLDATVGQTVIGLVSNSSTRTGQGFWYQVTGSTPVSVEDFPSPLPDMVSLVQNYPNPVHSSTTFKFSIPEGSPVVIEVYNMLGTLVKTVFRDNLPSGLHEVRWENVDLPTGLYAYHLRVHDHSISRIMTILR